MLRVHAKNPIIDQFDNAASTYDDHACFQEIVARKLVQRVRLPSDNIMRILDMGCGTGFVAQEAMLRWPQAHIDVLDPSERMLDVTTRKLPSATRLLGHADHIPSPRSYNLIFSSMMLHWLENPVATLKLWQQHLAPGGHIIAALLTEDSFLEWKNITAKAGVSDGLWLMPAVDFADTIKALRHEETLEITYRSAHAFLTSLKNTGAAMPRQGYRPVSSALMRRLLVAAPQPFKVTCRVLFLDISL